MNYNHWLEIKNIDCIYQNKKVFQNFSLNLALNQHSVILGPNGSGKTSIVKLINREIYPIHTLNSFISIFGKTNINIWEIRSRIGFVTREIEERIPLFMTPLEIIKNGLDGNITGHSSRNLKEEETKYLNILINSFDLKNLLNNPFGVLSAGEKRKTIIARAMINKPKILILDEPCINLDLKACYTVMDIIRKLTRLNTTILHITHRVDTIIPEISNVVLLKKGKILEKGDPENILKDEKLSNLYDINLKVIKENKCWQVIKKEIC